MRILFPAILGITLILGVPSVRAESTDKAAVAEQPSVNNPEETAISGAKNCVKEMVASKTLTQMGNHLSQPSASIFGLLTATFVSLYTDTLKQNDNENYKELMKYDPKIISDLSDTLKKYGISDMKSVYKTGNLPKSTIDNGRNFLLEIAGEESRLEKSIKSFNKDHPESSMNLNMENPFPDDIGNYTYKYISQMDVKIGFAKPISDPILMQSDIHVIQEGNKWYLDLGDTKKMITAIGAAIEQIGK